jgi:short subunit dehydrogenase-like uncharacterized protein
MTPMVSRAGNLTVVARSREVNEMGWFFLCLVLWIGFEYVGEQLKLIHQDLLRILKRGE